jgi:hypothetical protein
MGEKICCQEQLHLCFVWVKRFVVKNLEPILQSTKGPLYPSLREECLRLKSSLWFWGLFSPYSLRWYLVPRYGGKKPGSLHTQHPRDRISLENSRYVHCLVDSICMFTKLPKMWLYLYLQGKVMYTVWNTEGPTRIRRRRSTVPENREREVGEERPDKSSGGGRGRNGGGNPNAHPYARFYRQDRAISRAAPSSSCQAPIRPDWRGKLDAGRRPQPGWRRPREREDAGKWFDPGNQTWAGCTERSWTGLWTASSG